MSSQSPHLARLCRVAVLVALGDYVTKQLAVLWVGGLGHSLSSFVRFAVVHNDKAAFGLDAGAYTFELNLALTLGAIALIIPVSRELAEIDDHAPAALGLIVGGALGNLISLVDSPRGVVDFIAVRLSSDGELVLNVADVGAYVGLAMLVRTGVMIVRTMTQRSTAAPAPAGGRVVSLASRSKREMDIEIPRPLFRDGIVAYAIADRAGQDEPHTEREQEIPVPLTLERGSDGGAGRPVGGRARDGRDGGATHVRPMSHRREAR